MKNKFKISVGAESVIQANLSWIKRLKQKGMKLSVSFEQYEKRLRELCEEAGDKDPDKKDAYFPRNLKPVIKLILEQKGDPESPLFKGKKTMHLPFLEESIIEAREEIMDMSKEGGAHVEQLLKTHEMFPDLLSEQEVKELSKQHVDIEGAARAFLIEQALILLRHQGLNKGFAK